MNWNWRILAATAYDIAAALAAWSCAYWLRFNFDIPPLFAESMRSSLWVVLPLQGLIFYSFGLYRGIWRFASIPDLRRIAVASGTAALATPVALFMVNRLHEVPRSALVLDPLLLVLMMGGGRFVYRAWKDGHLFSPRQLDAMPVLVLGAGEAAAALLRDLARNPRWQVMGLLDDDEGKVGRQIHGANVLGRLEDLPVHARRLNVQHAIVAMPGVGVGVRRHAIEIAVGAGLQALTVPALGDVLSGKVSVSEVRQVELEDLLGREAVQLDDAGLHGLLGGKVVLVTGAGGSIGSELCRQVARFGPARLICFDQSEYALYKIGEEFAVRLPDLATCYAVGDVRDETRLTQVFAAHRPQLVFHAAAYKHVPLMEQENAWQAVRNNVLGTYRVAQVAIANGAEECVLVSTDKAVNPTNVMGASKRLAEQVCRALQAGAGATRFVTVRFGNVLGSSGSVIPKFREQIAAGGPMTVTHPDIVRYFMLIPEAAQLVLQAGLMGRGGELLVLDMGEPVKIVDLARDMIRLSGYTEEEIGIEFAGLRPGEKLYEELLADSETTLPTPHPKLRIAKADGAPDAAWLAALERWLAVPVRDEAEVKAGLRQWVPEYRPVEH
ncbi:MAG: polysaccharide biosynthesis protein [Rhodocyclaceae bacterium]|nr:polysaccharide biosynthesis protein [Rhodocyclaceae bacterium]